MRLSSFDDFPCHQAPAPFAVPATSDVHFNDGYWFAAYAEDWYLAAGLRVHPNTNVMDGFAAVARGGEQEAVRASRALRPDSDTLAVGPLRVEILEPLARLRVALDGAPADLAFDLAFEARAEPFGEAPYEHRKHGRLINHLVRYTQVCRAHGHVRRDGEEVAVEGWHAMRDHSWGIRSSMGPRTPAGGHELAPEEVDRRRFRLWVPFETGAHVGFFHTHEGEGGEPLDVEGRLTDRDGRAVAVTRVRHALTYEPGTLQPAGGSFALTTDDGEEHEFTLTRAGTPADVQGLGYYGGWHDGGSAGVWRGTGPHVEHDRYATGPFSGPPHVPARRRLGPTEFPCRITDAAGNAGMAHFEHHVLGRYEPYGLDRPAS